MPAPLRPRAPPSQARIIITSTSTSTHLDAEPHPAFLEMVGRLAGAYCPPLLPTEVVDVARSALRGRIEADVAMDEVETVARATLELAAARPGRRTAAAGDLQP